MGIHSGPVSGVVDVNERANLTGAGINMAKRVMDCGDAGHILLSRHVAEDLEEYEQWRPLLHDLGDVRSETWRARRGRKPLWRSGRQSAAAAKIRDRAETRVASALGSNDGRLLVLAAIVAGIAMFSRYRVRPTLNCAGKKHRGASFRKSKPGKEKRVFH